MKRIFTFITLCSSLWANAQQPTEITLLPNEQWWGGFTGVGKEMPYQPSERIYNLRTENFNNQSVPYLLSNKGRYIAADTPFAYQFQERKIVITLSRGTVSCQSSKGNDLKSAISPLANSIFRLRVLFLLKYSSLNLSTTRGLSSSITKIKKTYWLTPKLLLITVCLPA